MSEPFIPMGECSISDAVDANKIIVGVSRDNTGGVILALGRDGLAEGTELWLVLECPPGQARQIAASLLNKADSVEGIK